MTANYRVDLSDPRQRALFERGRHVDLSALGEPSVPQVVQLAGDEATGLRASFRLSAAKQEVGVVFGDLFLTVDVYAVPGEPLKVHLYCPRCHKHMTVGADRKHIEFEPTAPSPIAALLVATGNPELARLSLGRLSIETFECPWELGDHKHVPGVLHTGVTLCRQRLVIDNNRARSG